MKLIDKFKSLFNKGQEEASTEEENNYITIAFGCNEDGRCYFSFYKYGDELPYDKFNPDEKDMITGILTQGAATVRELQRQSIKPPKYNS